MARQTRQFKLDEGQGGWFKESRPHHDAAMKGKDKRERHLPENNQFGSLQAQKNRKHYGFLGGSSCFYRFDVGKNGLVQCGTLSSSESMVDPKHNYARTITVKANSSKEASAKAWSLITGRPPEEYRTQHDHDGHFWLPGTMPIYSQGAEIIGYGPEKLKEPRQWEMPRKMASDTIMVGGDEAPEWKRPTKHEEEWDAFKKISPLDPPMNIPGTTDAQYFVVVEHKDGTKEIKDKFRDGSPKPDEAYKTNPEDKVFWTKAIRDNDALKAPNNARAFEAIINGLDEKEPGYKEKLIAQVRENAGLNHQAKNTRTVTRKKETNLETVGKLNHGGQALPDLEPGQKYQIVKVHDNGYVEALNRTTNPVDAQRFRKEADQKKAQGSHIEVIPAENLYKARDKRRTIEVQLTGPRDKLFDRSDLLHNAGMKFNMRTQVWEGRLSPEELSSAKQRGLIEKNANDI